MKYKKPKEGDITGALLPAPRAPPPAPRAPPPVPGAPPPAPGALPPALGLSLPFVCFSPLPQPQAFPTFVDMYGEKHGYQHPDPTFPPTQMISVFVRSRERFCLA